MSKRPRESDDLVEQLKLVCNDPLKVQGILANQNIVTVADVVTRLLAATISETPNPAKHGKKAHNRPRMLNELFVEAMLFMDRDSLDSMQLACRFMLDYIREHEATELALRQISTMSLGDVRRADGPNRDDEEYWLPVMRVSRYSCDDDKELSFNCVHGLLPYLRLAFCQFVHVDLRTIQSASDASYEVACGMLFGDLSACEIPVNWLSVYSDQGSVDLLNRSIDAFKSVRMVCMETTSDDLIEPQAFNEAFFASLAHRGIRHFDSELKRRFLEVDAQAALAYAFAEPMNGVSREPTGLQFRNVMDFLKIVRKKAAELDGRQRVDLNATISLLTIDPTGFEKYKEGEDKWVVNDLDNGLQLEIEEPGDYTVLIHVYSSI
ncbi:hypothetical protein AAVH_10814 [Aphelenchoides avenae]|nr:hypothetical protein AAVH_10814 [Aphelenchus avenae]